MSLHGNVQKFCDDSTMHGFKEYYYSRNCFLKLFWGIVIVGAASITAYQVYDAAIMYWEQPTVTIVYPLQDDIQKPNIDFCLHIKYVLSWMTFNSTIINKSTEKYFFHLLSKMTKLRGLEIFFSNLSYFNSSSYSSYLGNSWINKNTQSLMNASEEDYKKLLKYKRIKNELFFAKQFISKSPFVLVPQTVEKLMKATFTGSYICFSYSLNDAFNSKFAFQYSYFEQLFDIWGLDELGPISTWDEVNLKPITKWGLDKLGPITTNMLKSSYQDLFAEYSHYSFYSKYSPLLDASNFSGTSLPIFMVGIGNMEPLTIEPRLCKYIIRVNVNKLISINRQSKPCSSEDDIRSNVLMEIPKNKHLSCNYNCYNLCMYKKQNVSYCVTMDQIVGLQNSEDLNVRLCEPNEETHELSDIIDNECESKCPTSCNQWVYFASIQTDMGPTGFEFYTTLFEIIFPSSYSVLVSEELVAYTWTTLIGNIGGLLGLWLGASLLSFIQSIYLIFCYPKDPIEDVSSNVVTKVPKVNNKVGVIDVE